MSTGEPKDDTSSSSPIPPGEAAAPVLPPKSGEWQSRLHSADPVKPASPIASHEPKPLPVSQTHPVQIEFENPRLRVADFLFALLLVIFTFFGVSRTYSWFGHSWDEALYLYPSQNVASWVITFVDGKDKTIFDPVTINRYWGTELDGSDPLHPEIAPMPKLLTAFGLARLAHWFSVDSMTGSRLPFAALFSLTVALIYLLGAKEYGRFGGFAAAFMYMLMPRVFAHAHIAASETAVAFFIVLTVAFFLMANRRWGVAVFTGIALGFAIATKFTAFLLPVPLMIWGQIYRRKEYASNIFAMAFIAPVVMLALWPWLWHDTLRRFFSYVLFYTEHQKTALYYLGRPWGYLHGPVAPWYYPFHITAVSLPEWILLFSGLGIVRALFSFVRRPVTVLFLFLAFFWMGVSALPNAPRYDGERLFFPAFAFIALLAGAGFSGVFQTIQTIRIRRGANSSAGVKVIAALLLTALVGFGVFDIWNSRPNQLNYFNRLVGGPAGAYRKGFETTYWGEALNDEVLAQLNKTLKNGDKVKPLAINGLAFENLRKWGKLPAGVDFAPIAPPYDYFILQYRQGFMGRFERMLQRTQEPIYVFKAQGVPLIGLYSGEGVEGNTTPTLTVVTEPVVRETVPAMPETTATAALTTNTVAPAPLSPITTGTIEGTTVPVTLMELPPSVESLSTETLRTRYITTSTVLSTTPTITSITESIAPPETP